MPSIDDNGMDPKDDPEGLGGLVQFRCDGKEKAEWEAASRLAKKKTLSAWIRDTLNHAAMQLKIEILSSPTVSLEELEKFLLHEEPKPEERD